MKASGRNPLFASESLNDPRDPIIRGDCGPIRCRVEADFLDVEFGPGGSVWGPFVDGCVGTCVNTPATGGTSPDNAQDEWVGRLVPVPQAPKHKHKKHRHKKRDRCRDADEDRGCDGPDDP